MTEKKHTPLPFDYGGIEEAEVYAGGGQAIIYMDKLEIGPGYKRAIGLKFVDMKDEEVTQDEAIKIVKFIVKACNSHYDLLEALKKRQSKGHHNTCYSLLGEYQCNCGYEEAKQAISKAEGE
jgi:hypothetical protein